MLDLALRSPHITVGSTSSSSSCSRKSQLASVDTVAGCMFVFTRSSRLCFGLAFLDEYFAVPRNCCTTDLGLVWTQTKTKQKQTKNARTHARTQAHARTHAHTHRGSTGYSSVVRAPDSRLKGRRFESRQERRENYPLQGQFSVPTLISVSVPPPCYRSHFEGGRLQVNTHAAYVTGFA